MKDGESLPEGRDHINEAREKVRMLDNSIKTLELARRSRNAAAQQRIDEAVDKGRRIRQQIQNILKPLQN